MISKTISIALTAFMLAACGNSGKKLEVSGTAGQPGTQKVEFTSLVENPGDYVGKNISVEGKVVHVCMQSGKKLFLTGENMPKFPMELLGSEIIVEGTLVKAGAGATAEGEGMHAGNETAAGSGSDTCGTEEALAGQPVLAELMMVYNKHTLVK